MGTDTTGIKRRYRNATYTITGAPLTNVNRGGGSSSGAGQYYPASSFSLTANGTLSKTLYLVAYTQDTTTEDGSLVLKPGDSMLFTYFPNGGGAHNAAVEVVWWEAATTI